MLAILAALFTSVHVRRRFGVGSILLRPPKSKGGARLARRENRDELLILLDFQSPPHADPAFSVAWRQKLPSRFCRFAVRVALSPPPRSGRPAWPAPPAGSLPPTASPRRRPGSGRRAAHRRRPGPRLWVQPAKPPGRTAASPPRAG